MAAPTPRTTGGTVGGTPGGIGGSIRNLTQLIKKFGKKAWDALTKAEKDAIKAKAKLKPGTIGLSKEHPTGRAIRARRAEQKRQIEGAFD